MKIESNKKLYVFYVTIEKKILQQKFRLFMINPCDIRKIQIYI